MSDQNANAESVLLRMDQTEPSLIPHKAVFAFANYLGINLDTEFELVFLAREALNSVPPGWEVCINENAEGEAAGLPYFFNNDTQESSWQHPEEEYHKTRLVEERQKLANTFGKKKSMDIGPKTPKRKVSRVSSMFGDLEVDDASAKRLEAVLHENDELKAGIEHMKGVIEENVGLRKNVEDLTEMVNNIQMQNKELSTELDLLQTDYEDILEKYNAEILKPPQPAIEDVVITVQEELQKEWEAKLAEIRTKADEQLAAVKAELTTKAQECELLHNQISLEREAREHGNEEIKSLQETILQMQEEITKTQEELIALQESKQEEMQMHSADAVKQQEAEIALQANIAELTRAAEERTAELVKYKELATLLEKDLQEMVAEHAASTEELKSSHEEAQKAHRASHEEVQAAIHAKFQAIIDGNEGEMLRLREEIANLQQTLQEKESQAGESVAAMQSEVTDAKAKNAQMLSDLVTTKRERDVFAIEIEDQKSQNTALTDLVDQYEERLQSLQRDLDRKSMNLLAEQNRVAELKMQLEEHVAKHSNILPVQGEGDTEERYRRKVNFHRIHDGLQRYQTLSWQLWEMLKSEETNQHAE